MKAITVEPGRAGHRARHQAPVAILFCPPAQSAAKEGAANDREVP